MAHFLKGTLLLKHRLSQLGSPGFFGVAQRILGRFRFSDDYRGGAPDPRCECRASASKKYGRKVKIFFSIIMINSPTCDH